MLNNFILINIKNMGGGAGIAFNSTNEEFQIKISQDNNNLENSFIVEPILSSFDMIGYQDGMDNIKGDLLKAHLDISAYDMLEDNMNIIQGIENELNIKIKEIVVYGSVELNDMFFGGYTRGDSSSIKNIDTDIEINDVEIETIDGEIIYYEGLYERFFDDYEKHGSINIVFNPKNEEDFSNCYDDIFNFNPYESDDKEDIEELYEFHYEDVKINWGADS